MVEIDGNVGLMIIISIWKKKILMIVYIIDIYYLTNWIIYKKVVDIKKIR